MTDTKKETALTILRWANVLQSMPLAQRFHTYIQLYGEGMESRVDAFLDVAEEQGWLQESNISIYRRFKKFMEPYKMAHGQYERAEYMGQLWLSPEAAIILEEKLAGQEYGRREKVKMISNFIIAEEARFAALEAQIRVLQMRLQSYLGAAQRFEQTLLDE